MKQESCRPALVVLACLCVLALFAYARGQSGGPLQQSVADAEKLNTALKLYLNDWDEGFPPMTTHAAFQEALKDYAPPADFICALTGRPYQPNPALSLRYYAVVQDEGSTPAVSAAIPGGEPLVCYLDGHVQQGKVDLTDPTAETVQDAQRITKGLLSYTQDYDEQFPIAKTQNQLQQVLASYVRDEHAFTCPLSGKPFRFNFQLSGVSVASVLDLDTTPAFWDHAGQPNNQSVIACLDLSVWRGGVDLIDPIQVGSERIGRLIAALKGYAQDHDQALPPMQNAAVFKQAVYPYVQSDRDFISPFSQQPYRPNPALSGTLLSRVRDLSAVFGVKDPVRASDGKSMIGYLDGAITWGGAGVEDPLQATTAHARQLTLALLQYTQDYDEVLPPMATFAQFKSSIFPYVRASRAFTCPYTHTLFDVNTALNLQPLAGIAAPAITVVLQDPKPELAGRRTTGYLDGHVKRVLNRFISGPR